MSMKMDPLQQVLADAKGLAERLKRKDRPQLTEEDKQRMMTRTPVQEADARVAEVSAHPSGFGIGRR